MANNSVVVPIDLSVTDIRTDNVSLKDVEKSITDRLSGIAKSAGDVLGKIDTSKLNKALTTSMNSVTASYQKLSLAQSKVNDALRTAGSSSPKFKAELKAIEAEIKKTEDAWENFADLLLQDDVLQKGLNKRDMGLQLTPAEASKVDFFDVEMDKYEAKLADLQARMPDPTKFVDSASTAELQKLVNAYYALFNAVSKVETATDNWNKTRDANQTTDEYNQKINELTALEKKLDSVKAKSEKMANTGASSKSWKTLHYDATALESKIKNVIAELQTMVKTGNAFRFDASGSAAELDALNDRLGRLSTTMSQIKSEPSSIKGSINGLIKIMNNFCKSASKGLSDVIGNLKKMCKTSARTTKDMGKSFRKLWKDLLMFGFGVRSTFFLIRRLRNVFIEAFNGMSKQIPEVNDTLSSFKTSLNQLKGSIATAFQPIISAVIPYLNQLIAALSRAMEALGRFFATLTGQGYIYKFTAAQVDYAESLDGTAGAAKKAQKSLMGFDEINKLSDEDAGGGGEVPTGTWEKEMLDGMSNLAQLIKDAWSTGDFFEVGKYIGELLLEALKIADDWITTKGYAFAEKLGKSLATLINGLVSIEGLGAQIGKTIAHAFNMALIFLDTFLTTTDWLSVGQFIADWANASVKNFDWALLGKTVADLITAAVNMWWQFVGEFDFSALGSGIATAINNLFSNLLAVDETGLSSAEKLGQAITNTVRGLLDTLTTAINDTNWSAVGETIGQVLANIDWAGIAWDFTKLVGAIVKAIAETFLSWAETDPISASVAAMLGTAFAGVKLAPIISSLWSFGAKVVEVVQLVAGGAGTLGEAISAVFGTGAGLFAGIASVVSGVIIAFTNFFSMLKNGFSWLKEILMVIGIALAAVGAIILGAPALVAGIIAAIVAAVATLVVVIKDNWQAICDFFISVWTTISNFFVEVWNGIVTGVTTGLAAISAWWTSAWTNIKTFFVDLWNSIVQNVTTFINNVKTVITNTVTAISTWWTSTWTSIKTTASNIWNGIKTTISTAINAVKTGITNTINNIKTAWSNGWNAMKTAVTNIWNGIWSVIKNIINSIIGGINGMIRGVVSGINAVIGVLNKLSFKVPDWVPGMGGNSFGFNIGTVSAPQIPKLAQGGVIPPNKEFMAILGDQKHGTNIEAPLDTIKQAVAEELAEYIDAMMTGFQAVVEAVNNKDFDVTIGDSAIGKAAERYSKRQALVRGTA